MADASTGMCGRGSGVLSDIACHMMQGQGCHNYISDLNLVMTLVAAEYGFAKAREERKVSWDSCDKAMDTISTWGKGHARPF